MHARETLRPVVQRAPRPLPTLGRRLAEGALLLGPCVAPAAAAPWQLDAYELVVVEPSGGSSFAVTGCSDVNDQGLVVGLTSVDDVLVHFEWTADAGFSTPTHLPPTPPHLPPAGNRRVNSQGDSVFLGVPDLVLADGTTLPIPDPLGTDVGALTDLNDALRVIGQGVSTGTDSGIFTWTPQGGSQAVLIPAARSLRRVNAHGQAVGYRLYNDTDRRAFVVDLDTGAWVDLDALLPPVGTSEALDVNDSGVVVGTGPDGSSQRAFVWSPATGFTFLPGLADTEVMYVQPRAIDNRGRVVGTARTADDGYHAFLWDPAVGMIDLDDLVVGGGFKLVEALDISESGVIIGRGFHGTAWGPDRGFVLRPVGGGPAGFEALCFGVGCPCGNDDPAAGCANSTGSGGRLQPAGGTRSVTADDLVLSATGLPADNQGLFYMGDTPAVSPFFDGLQCALGTTFRFLGSIQSTGSAGTMAYTGWVGASGGLIGAGSTWYFHCWHRDVPGSPCGTGANLTHLLGVTFTP